MESEKIKKGLECCSMLMDNTKTAEEQDNACSECPYRKNDRCSWKLDADALTLIKELESRIAELIKELEKEQINNLNCDTELQYKEDRIAELEKENAKYKQKLTTNQWVQEIRKEALKQFAERLKEKGQKSFINEKDIF